MSETPRDVPQSKNEKGRCAVIAYLSFSFLNTGLGHIDEQKAVIKLLSTITSDNQHEGQLQK